MIRFVLQFALRLVFANMFVNAIVPISDIYIPDGFIINQLLKDLESQSHQIIKTICFETNCNNSTITGKNSLVVDSLDYSLRLSIDSKGNVKICTNLDSYKVHDCSFMFSGLDSLRSINLSGLDTSDSKSMRSMFQNCISLESVDISSLKTHNVKIMMDMFSGCTNLQCLSFNNLDLSKLETVAGLFQECKSLKDVSFKNNSTRTIKRTENMFLNCENLIHLEMSDLNLSKVSYAVNMFKNCTRLEHLDLNNFSAKNLDFADEMFSGCSSLKVLELQNMETTHRPGLRRLFYGAFQDDGKLYLGKNFKIDECDVCEEIFRGCGHISIEGKIRLRNRLHLQSLVEDGVKSKIDNDSIFP